MKFIDLHVHSKDQYDSDNSAERVCKKTAELGRTKIAITQHGVAAAIEDFKAATKKYGLGLIPGIEAYYQANAVRGENGLMEAVKESQTAHLILLAMNDAGWKAISVAISSCQKKDGQCLLNDEALMKYFGPGSAGHGNVVATSACVQGPVALTLRANEHIEKAMEKLSRKENGDYEGTLARLAVATKNVEARTKQVNNLKEELKQARKLAKTAFTKKEKAVEKLKEKGDASYPEELEKLNREKAAAAAAEERSAEIWEEISALNTSLSAMKAEKKKLEGIKEKSEETHGKKVALQGMMQDEAAMEAEAVRVMSKFKEMFGEGNFYAEVQNHGIDLEEDIYPKVARIARALNIPIVATNDVHLVENTEEELLRRRMLKALRFEKWEDDRVGDDQYYIKTDEEMEEWLLKILPADVVEEAMSNTLAIAERSDVKFEVEKHFPKYISDDGRSSKEVFADLLEKGIKEKFGGNFDEEHRKRLKIESDTMEKMGYIDYHLVVWDFCKYASEYDAIPFDKINEAPIDLEALKAWKVENGYTEKTGLSNGPGRGSAVGSIVCDLLGITHLDPIKYQLLFERFLNPERVSLPDIDSDISRTVRPRVIQYVTQKYGKECVAGIITQNAQGPKGSVRIAAKCLGLFENRENKTDNGAKKYLRTANTIAKAIPLEVGTAFDTKTNGEQTLYEELLEKFRDIPEAAEIIRWAKVFEGCFTTYGSHAAGFVITDGTPVDEIVPLRWNDKLGIYTTQCDMVQVEENGTLKFDFLGLRTLDIINDVLWELKDNGVSINVYDIPMDDKEVFSEIFAKAKTNSVFQFESTGMKQMLKRFRPESFEDLIILVSMFRPGPLQYLDGVIEVKNGKEPEYLTPKLKPILGKTYGAIVYQEQVMQIFQHLAGYTLGGADLVRRFMSKKKMDKLQKEREAFVHGDPERGIEGCVKRGVTEEAAQELFTQMTEFAKYAFNKSHAAAYAYNAYITGWLKYHYPAEFMMAAMRWAEKTQKKDPIPGLMAEAKSLGVKVNAPDINRCGKTFEVEDGEILFGLNAVKSVGASADGIIAERERGGEFLSLLDFHSRVSVKKNALENLIRAGALDCFNKNRAALLACSEEYKELMGKANKKKSFIKTAKAVLPFVDEVKDDEKLIKLQEDRHLTVELKEATTAEKLEKRIQNAEKALKELEAELAEIRIRTEIPENRDEKMAAEKELLGAYVTAHPLDIYPSAEELGVGQLEDIHEKTTRIFGIITEIQEKKRKSDGKPMAFLTVEDRTGSIQANLFTAAYEKNSRHVEVGKVVVIDGKTQEDSFLSDEDEEKTYLFIAERLTPVKKTQVSFMMNVSSVATFHTLHEASFRAKYEEADGHKLYLFDEKLREVRQMKYRVSDQAAEVAGVQAI